jgi:hypothetical protein
MGGTLFGALQSVFALFWRCHFRDLKHLPPPGPAVLVANHLGSYAPLAVLSSFPGRLYPWVNHEVTDRKLCPDYLRADFVEPELHLGPPLGRAAAWLISKPCLALMRAIEAVPVYSRSMRLAATWKRSLGLLLSGQRLVVFPESNVGPLYGAPSEFLSGFVGLAGRYHKRTGRALCFYPLAVHKESRAIRIGPPVAYNPRNGPSAEGRRIKRILEGRVTEMYSAMAEEELSVRRAKARTTAPSSGPASP